MGREGLGQFAGRAGLSGRGRSWLLIGLLGGLLSDPGRESCLAALIWRRFMGQNVGSQRGRLDGRRRSALWSALLGGGPVASPRASRGELHGEHGSLVSPGAAAGRLLTRFGEPAVAALDVGIAGARTFGSRGTSRMRLSACSNGLGGNYSVRPANCFWTWDRDQRG